MEGTLISRALLAAVCAAPLLGAAEPAATDNERLLWQRLCQRVETLAGQVDGVVAVSLKDLERGTAFELRAEQVLPTASTIKVAVLYELYRQAEEGRVDLAEVTRPPLPRVGGGGVLQELGGSVSLTWRDLAVLMMGWSDNEATNRLIERVGLPSVDRRLASLGFTKTRLRRRMMDLDAARRGDENVSSAGELRRLSELLRDAPGLSPARAEDLLAVAAVPKSSPFRAPLPEGLPVADKPGDLDGVRAACGYVALPGRPYALAVMSGYLKRDADGEQVIRDISAAVYETFERLARSSAYGRRME